MMMPMEKQMWRMREDPEDKDTGEDRSCSMETKILGRGIGGKRLEVEDAKNHETAG